MFSEWQINMQYKDLRDFIAQLETQGKLLRISQPISTDLEMTEIADRTLRAGGPALLFENAIGHDMPVLANLFGTPERRYGYGSKFCRSIT